MPAVTDVEAHLRPLRESFPLADGAVAALIAEIRRLYPPVPAITRICIADPATGKAVRDLTAASEIRAKDLPAGATIAADVSSPCTLVFEFDGVAVRQESNPPYSIAGDLAGGKLNRWDGLTSGSHTLRVTPFDKPGGRAGAAIALSFAIIADPVVSPPTPPVVDAPPIVVVPPDLGFTVLPLAAGAKQIYVRADGDDDNTGAAPSRPVRSIRRAMSLLRPAAGDRILLRAADRFDTPIGSWRFSGIPGKPAGIFAWDDGSPECAGRRPVIACRDANAIDIDAPGVHDVAFVGLHLTAADRDPADAGFRVASKSNYGVQALFPTKSVHLEDCRIDHFAFNVSFVCAGNKGRHENLVLRRCLLLDAWGPPTELYRGQGIYLERCRGVRLIECVLDHNGWIEGAAGVKPVRNIYRHGAYVNEAGVEDVIFEECLVSRNANYGVQLRAGGAVRRCVFYDNATSIGVGGESAEVSDNYIVGGHDTDQYSQRIAVEIFSRTVAVRGNVIVGDDAPPHGFPAARIHVSRRPWTPAGDRALRIEANTLHGCDGSAICIDDALAELTVRDNEFAAVRGAMIAIDKPVARLSAGGNRYIERTTFAHAAAKGKSLTFAQWSAITRDTSHFVVTTATIPTPWDTGQIARSRDRRRGQWPAAR